MLDHHGQISIPATAARRPVFVNAVVSYTLAYDAADVMDNGQIQISVALISRVRKPSLEPIVIAKRCGITPEKAQKTIPATMQRGTRTMLCPSLSRQFRTNDSNFHYLCLAHPVF